MAPQLALSVTTGFSREILDAYDAGKLDAVIVRQEGSRRGGEKLTEDEFGWFAAPRFAWRRGETLSLPYSHRPAACARLRCVRSTRPASPGARRLSAAASPRSPPPRWPGLRWRRWRGGSRRRPDRHRSAAAPCHALGTSKVMLHSRVSDAARRAALRTLAATFRSVASKG